MLRTWLASLGVRRAGAVVAGAIATLWTPLSIPGLTRAPDPDTSVFDPITPAFLTVVPVAAVLAYLLAPRLLAWSTRRAILITAIAVVVVNAMVVAEFLTLRGINDTIGVDRLSWLIGAAFVGAPMGALFGLIYVGPFALIPAGVSAAGWLWVMRRLVHG